MSYTITKNDAEKIIQRERQYHTRKHSKIEELFLTMFGLGNETRLNLVEANVSSGTLLGRGFLPSHFGIFGLAYFFRLIYNISDLLAQTILEKKEDDNRSFVTRLLDNLKNDRNRLQQLANDIVWGPLNLACFLVSPLASMALTVAGVTFDTIHTCVVFARDMYHYKELKVLQTHLQSLKENLRAKEEALAELLESPNSSAKVKGQTKIEIADLKKQINETKQDIKNFKDYYSLDDNRSSVIGNRLANLGLVLMFSVGITLTFFPPTTLAGALLLGGAAVLGGASIVGKLWKLGSSLWGKTEAKPQPKEHPNEGAVEMQNLSTHALASKGLGVDLDPKNDQKYDERPEVKTKEQRQQQVAEVRAEEQEKQLITKAEFGSKVNVREVPKMSFAGR